MQEHTGVHHVCEPSKHRVTLDQYKYASSTWPIDLAGTSAASENEEVTKVLMGLFLALLGAVAWLLVTRVDIAVYVNSLQRVAKAPQLVHLKRLKRFVKYIQANPVPLTYEKLEGDRVYLIDPGDSAFNALESDGLAQRCYLYALGSAIRVDPIEWFYRFGHLW